MSQNNFIQFCRDLGITIDEILYKSNELLYIIGDFENLYRPKTRDEADEFYGIGLRLPDSAQLLCDIKKNAIPDDDELYDTVAHLRDIALDVVSRMLSVNLIINDIIKTHFKPHEDDVYVYIYLQLTMLKWLQNSIHGDKEKLYNIYKEVSILYPDLLVSDDDIEEEEEETFLPDEVESFQFMSDVLIQALKEYIEKNESELYNGFIEAIQNYLEDFGNGIEPNYGFDFSFSLRSSYGHLKDIDFHFETGIIEVTSGGSVYDEDVGSDSYTDWMYGIGLNGWEDYNYNYDFSEVLELISCGAKLNIENPEEFADCEEDE